MVAPIRHLLGQALLLAAFAGTVAGFSGAPEYRQRSPEDAVLKVSLTHPGQRIHPCTQRSPEELAKLPPNMRIRQQCQRGRYPVSLAMDVDGRPALALTAKPAGLASDGASRFYDRREIAPGRHLIRIRMTDGPPAETGDQQAEQTIVLVPGQVFIIDFDDEDRRFVFK